MLNTENIKKDFSIFKQSINGHPLTYLDNAATTQKPKTVIKALTDYYENYNSNIHRGIHSLAEKATEAYENTRKTVKNFINANSEKEIIFTKNATESINLVAYTWGEQNVQKGDEIIISIMEHHSNFLRWKLLAEKKEAILHIIPFKNDYSFDLENFKNTISKKTKIVAITAMSNVLGSQTPIKEICKIAHKAGAKILIDGAQSVPHISTNVQDIDCDFLVFSAHKMLGPTGVGVLYGKEEILEEMHPFLYGGEMVQSVNVERTKYSDLPWKFEAGTPNIGGVIAFNEAIKYLEKIGMENIHKHDIELLKYAKEKFTPYKNMKKFIPKDKNISSGILSFSIKGTHPHDIATIFNEYGIAIRAGFHCAEPLIIALKARSLARISFYIYNNKKDIDKAEKAIIKILEIFK